jgi:SSS family solute:Na+ symporter
LALLLGPVFYGALMLLVPDLAFLDRIAVAFGLVLVVLAAMTLLRPLPEPLTLPRQAQINLDSSRGAMFCGGVMVVLTNALYAVFW